MRGGGGVFIIHHGQPGPGALTTALHARHDDMPPLFAGALGKSSKSACGSSHGRVITSWQQDVRPDIRASSSDMASDPVRSSCSAWSALLGHHKYKAPFGVMVVRKIGYSLPTTSDLTNAAIVSV